ncbi:MAG: glycoside hydrolase family 2 protein [Armatimonadota bacterium]
MKTTYNLSQLDWSLTGWLPYLWKLGNPIEANTSQSAEITAIPAKVPGSVQMALLQAGLLPDWNVGLNYRACQWVENLHWVYQATIPDEWLANKLKYRLNCQGLDGSGWVLLNGVEVKSFNGSHIPHVINLPSKMQPTGNILQIVFDCPPRWLGQFGYTSKMTDWKVRFNYTWDWTVRLVQTGVWDTIEFVATDGVEITKQHFMTIIDEEDGACLAVWGKVKRPGGYTVRLSLEQNGSTLRSSEMPAYLFNKSGIMMTCLDLECWWPNLNGSQPLYDARLTLLDEYGAVVDEQLKRVGFRDIFWVPCEDAPHDADSWILTCNDKPVFVQGANWVPIRPNFADVTVEQYRQHLELYKELGFNLLRVWGGGVLEKECFYDICDELGIMVWQEFPLSSSGIDNYPPEDAQFISEMVKVAKSYIDRRRHHASLVIWCGGNELYDSNNVPVTINHPMIKALAKVCKEKDGSRRFVAASGSGPRSTADKSEFGQGVNWDVHGPWKPGGFGMADESLAEWADYWAKDDALFRSETGCSGASSLDILERYRGECEIMPVNASNPLWRRPICWWIDYDNVVKDYGREPLSPAEYVQWSQQRQSQALEIAVKACKSRFPKCGGVIIWMGHDCFPCAANTSVIDYECRPKPAALAISKVFKS